METKHIVDLLVAVLVLLLFGIGIFIDLVHNPSKRTWTYRRIRTMNWVSMGWAKAFQMMARYTFYALSTQVGSTYLNLDNTQYAIITTIGLWTMPISLLVNGWLVDRFREKACLLVGLLGHAIVNLIFAFILLFFPDTLFLTISSFIFYPVTCYFQTFSEIVINKNNAAFYNSQERGIIAGVFTLCLSIGYLMGFAGNSLIVELTNAATLFFVVSGLLLFSFFTIVIFLKEDYKDPEPQKPTPPTKAIPISKEHIQKEPVEESITATTSGKIVDEEAAKAVDIILREIDDLDERDEKDEAKMPLLGSIEKSESEEDATPVDAEERHKPKHHSKKKETKSLDYEPPADWRDVVFTFDFLLMCLCFALIGMLRDGFFVWLNQYLQVRFQISIGSPEQLLAFSSLTIGAALSAFYSALLNEIFPNNNSWNGVVCFLTAAIFYFGFGITDNKVLMIVFTGLSTTAILAVLGIRRVLSMSLGGYTYTGLITALLGAATFIGGGLGSLFFEWIIYLFTFNIWVYSLVGISMVGVFLFLISAIKQGPCTR